MAVGLPELEGLLEGGPALGDRQRGEADSGGEWEWRGRTR